MYRPGSFRYIFFVLLLTVIGPLTLAQGNTFEPVTDAILTSPDAGDGLILSQTCDEQKGFIALVTLPAAIEMIDATHADLICRYERDTAGKVNHRA